ncbi:MAG: nucleoside deaminase [Boseongicola sp.]|nr:nucleoside deaminase [Boseongicola sp.]
MGERGAFRLPEDAGERARLLSRLLETIENDIVPLTTRGVAAGNKVFGAALLMKSDLSLVLAETNNEVLNPLWHGEMQCLKAFFELKERPRTDELLFLSTHEPCSLCLSAITWAGFDNFFHLFSHEDSRDDFAIPHDLRILREVFGLDGGRYSRSNAYWSCWSITDEIARLGDDARAPLAKRSARIASLYQGLSETYQATKHASAIPLR